MKIVLGAALFVSLLFNAYLGYMHFQNEFPGDLKSDLPYQNNLTDFLSYMDGFAEGVSKGYKYYNSPLIYPVFDPVHYPRSPYDEGLSRAVKMSEKKCEKAFDLKIEALDFFQTKIKYYRDKSMEYRKEISIINDKYNRLKAESKRAEKH